MAVRLRREVFNSTSIYLSQVHPCFRLDGDESRIFESWRVASRHDYWSDQRLSGRRVSTIVFTQKAALTLQVDHGAI